MISIVDPDELQHVLRPTVYAPTVGLRTTPARGLRTENVSAARQVDSVRQDEPVNSSQQG